MYGLLFLLWKPSKASALHIQQTKSKAESTGQGFLFSPALCWLLPGLGEFQASLCLHGQEQQGSSCSAGAPRGAARCVLRCRALQHLRAGSSLYPVEYQDPPPQPLEADLAPVPLAGVPTCAAILGTCHLPQLGSTQDPLPGCRQKAKPQQE